MKIKCFTILLCTLLFGLIDSVAFAATPSLSAIAGMKYQGTTAFTFLAVADPSRRSWTYVDPGIPYNPYGSQILGSSCTGSGANALCAITGYSYNANGDGGMTDFLRMSTDNGKTWVNKQIFPQATWVGYGDVACFGGYGESARCVVDGFVGLKPGKKVNLHSLLLDKLKKVNKNNLHRNKPMVFSPNLSSHLKDQLVNDGDMQFYIATTEDGGKTWHTQLHSLSDDTILTTQLTCSGKSADGQCLFLGFNAMAEDANNEIVWQSNNGGDSWSQTLTQFPAGIAMSADPNFNAHCTDGGPNAICIAPFELSTYVSKDHGMTWITEQNPAGGFSDEATPTSCTGTGPSALCVVLGRYRIGTNPVLIVTHDGGTTWTSQPVTASAILRTVSCTGEGKTAICVAAGDEENVSSGIVESKPLIYVSTDGAVTWTRKTIPGYSSGMLLQASCDERACVIAGDQFKDDNAAPILVASFDGGLHWETQSINGMPSLSGKLGLSPWVGGENL